MQKPKSDVEPTAEDVGRDRGVEVAHVAKEPEFTTADVPHAPIIFFESAPTFGVYAGVVRVTLGALRSLPGTDSVKNDVVVTAYLRCSLPAALELRSALDKALLLAAPVKGDAQ